MLTVPEQRALRVFRQYLMTPHRMLCFSGPNLEQHETALEALSNKDFLRREKRPGSYSLTRAGFTAMKHCD